jgi:uncharacterized membrane protein
MDRRSPSGLPVNSSLPVVPLLLIALLSLGLLLRIANLDQKIFWVDEVATAIRAVGYTKAEVIARLADGTPHYPTDLLAYQRLTSERTLTDTLKALIHSPEHAPLYFLLTRFWMQCFGSSVSAIRSFSVLCSLLTLPAVYWLAQELFGCRRVSWTAVALIAISPFFIAYAQEARPYSCWLLLVVLSAGALLRALRLNTGVSWTAYSITLILSCYTSLLSLLLIVGQGIYALSLDLPAKSLTRTSRRCLFAVSIALLAFLPWIWVVLNHQADLANNTTWMRSAIQPMAMVAIWLYSFAVLFFDVPIVVSGWLAVGEALIAAIVLSILGFALYRLTRLPRRIGLFVAALCLPIPLTLLLLDLIVQGQASATPRYLIPCQFGVLLAVAALISGKTIAGGAPIRLRHSIAAFLLGLSLLSGWVNLARSPAYQKDRNQHNPEIAALLNKAEQPLVLAEPSQTMDLLSLSHSLKPTVQVQIMPLEQIRSVRFACRVTFLFNPSSALITAIQATGLQVQQIYKPTLLTPSDVHLTLWQTAAGCHPPI